MHQICLNASELELFEYIREWRRLKKKVTGDPSRAHLLTQTLEFYGYTGKRRLGPYHIDATNAIHELAGVGGEIMREIQSEEGDASEPTIQQESVEDRDSVLGTQSEPDELDATEDEPIDPPSWEWVRETLPSYVKEVSFAVDEAGLDPQQQKELRDRFPDVVIRPPVPPTDVGPGTIPSQVDIPAGVKRAIFEVVDAEADENPEIGEYISQVFPWATLRRTRASLLGQQRPLQMVGELSPALDALPAAQDTTAVLRATRPPAKSNHGVPRAPSNPGAEATTPPVKHLQSFSKYIMQPLVDDEFGYKYQINEGWNTLPDARKEAIAHARCIQGRHGENVDTDKRCTNCTERGYTCRMYQASLTPVANMDLGYGCQNCRVWAQPCDSAHSQRPSEMKSPTTPVSAAQQTTHTPASRAQTRETGSVADTAPTANNPAKKPSLVDRMSNDIRIKGAAEAEKEQHPPSVADDADPLPTQSMVSYVAKQKGIEMAHPGVIESMFNEWVTNNRVLPFKYGKFNLEHCYSNLVDLCIVGQVIDDAQLQEQVLRMWQQTNYQHTAYMPKIGVVIKAFQHLRPESALQRWNTVFFSYLWDTADAGSYEEFREDLKDYDTEAIAAFLYSVAQTRCPHTKGLDIPVLESWCDFHDHPMNSREELQCKQERDRIYALSGRSLSIEKSKHEAKELENAKILIKSFGGSVLMKDNSFTAAAPTSSKRKADTSPAKNYRGKKSRRGLQFNQIM